MTVFDIKKALDSNRRDGGSDILAMPLHAKNKEDKVILVGYHESELVLRSLGRQEVDLEELIEPDYGQDYESTLERCIVYGQYRPQYGLELSHSEAKHYVRNHFKNWLAFLDEDELHVHGVGIEDIILAEEQIEATCPYCPEPHLTNYVAFAALLVKPSHAQLIDPKGCPIIAFERNPHYHLVTDILSRRGVYLLNLEELTDPNVNINIKNWREFAAIEKAKLFAKYI